MTAGGVWTGPAIIYTPPCPSCRSTRATAVTVDLIRCLGRVWSEDLGRFSRCERHRYV